jgi:hypothetical protein
MNQESLSKQMGPPLITAMKIADQGDFSALIQFIEGCLPKPA